MIRIVGRWILPGIENRQPRFNDLATLQQRLAVTQKPLVWVITGDSITQGAKWTGGARAYPEIIHERVRFELGRRRDILINSGISGEQSAGLLADFQWRVLRFKPDVVSIMIGMNDACKGLYGLDAFAEALREMIWLSRAKGAIPILNRTNAIAQDSTDSEAASRSELASYNECIAQMAMVEDVILVDHWKYWTESTPASEGRQWLADSIHPNGAGHRQLAVCFFQAIGIYDAAAFSCRP